MKFYAAVTVEDPVSELHDFKDHPFKVEQNQELFELRQSMEKEGVLVPLLIRHICQIWIQNPIPVMCAVSQRKLSEKKIFSFP